MFDRAKDKRVGRRFLPIWMAVILPVVAIYCRTDFRVVTDKTYFAENGLSAREYSWLGTRTDGDSVVFRGMPEYRTVGKERMPVLTELTDDGIGYVYLDDLPDVDRGVRVEVRGTRGTAHIAFGVPDAEMTVPVLNVSSFRIIADMKPFLSLAQREYEKIRDEFQARLADGENKLKLPETPEWRLYIRESAEVVIVRMVVYDLMYVAEVDVVVDADAKQLRGLYTHQWFKGE
jgi:hypothetical protein